jgi:threonine/homoserine efflux transporter RhtA
MGTCPRGDAVGQAGIVAVCATDLDRRPGRNRVAPTQRGIFLAWPVPRCATIRGHDAPMAIGLGVTTGLVSIAFVAAIERVRLGTAFAVEFLGPMTVAAARSHSARALT